MNDAFYDFEWTVAPQYEWQDWIDGKGKASAVPTQGLASLASASAVELLWNQAQDKALTYGPLLCPVMKDASEARRYRPMARQHAALFREFSELDYTSQTAVMTFARAHGLLGVLSKHQSTKVTGADGRMRFHHAYGESFLDWAFEIVLMREGLQLSGQKHTFERLRRLKWLCDRNLQHVQARLAFDPAGNPKMALQPLTLIAAMWLQFALAVTGDKQFVACKFCGRRFEHSTEQTGFRKHRQFCTDSCKTLDYRKRKRTAISLAASGRPSREISDKTGTDLKTVRAWLAAAKEAGRKKARKGA